MKFYGAIYLLSMVLVVWASEAGAQDGCLQSFNVKSDKPLLTYDWLPGRPQRAQALTCTAAERLRERIYVANRAQIDAAANGDPGAYLSAADGAIAEAEEKVKALEAAIQRNESLSGLQLAGEVMLYELGKAEFLITCIAPEATVSKLFCGAGFISLGLATYRIMNGSTTNNEFKQLGADSRTKLNEARAQLVNLRSKLNKDNFREVAKHNVDIFNGLCAAIKKDCL